VRRDIHPFDFQESFHPRQDFDLVIDDEHAAA
jgi:hypothetical protein